MKYLKLNAIVFYDSLVGKTNSWTRLLIRVLSPSLYYLCTWCKLADLRSKVKISLIKLKLTCNLKVFVELIGLPKIPKFHLIFWCGNCTFPQSFQTRKLGENMAFLQYQDEIFDPALSTSIYFFKRYLVDQIFISISDLEMFH